MVQEVVEATTPPSSPEPRRSLSLRLRRLSSSKKVEKDDAAPGSPKKMKKFPRIKGFVRRMSGRRKSKTEILAADVTAANISFDTEDTGPVVAKTLAAAAVEKAVEIDVMEGRKGKLMETEALMEAAPEATPGKTNVLEIILLVLDPATRHFELVLLEFFHEKFIVADILARIKTSVVQEELRDVVFEGVCDLSNVETLPLDEYLTNICHGNRREIFVAVAKDVALDVCIKQAKIILSDKEVTDVLKSSGVDCSAWAPAVEEKERPAAATAEVQEDAAKDAGLKPEEIPEKKPTDDIVEEVPAEETEKLVEEKALPEEAGEEPSDDVVASTVATNDAVDMKPTTKTNQAIEVLEEQFDEPVVKSRDFATEEDSSTKAVVVADSTENAVKETHQNVSTYLLYAAPVVLLAFLPKVISLLQDGARTE